MRHESKRTGERRRGASSLARRDAPSHPLDGGILEDGLGDGGNPARASSYRAVIAVRRRVVHDVAFALVEAPVRNQVLPHLREHICHHEGRGMDDTCSLPVSLRYRYRLTSCAVSARLKMATSSTRPSKTPPLCTARQAATSASERTHQRDSQPSSLPLPLPRPYVQYPCEGRPICTG